ncbi:hypothetical protein LguiB_002699 [Lonicera macranthoides]
MSQTEGGANGGKGKKGSTVMIDCGKPVEDKIMEIASPKKFLEEMIKVGGKDVALGDFVTVTHEEQNHSLLTTTSLRGTST